MRGFRSTGTLIMILVMVLLASRNIAADPAGWFLDKLLILPGIIIGLSFHEFAHAFVADRLGDHTPAMMGRVTINPAAHIDLVGFAALLLIGFGWGKPVEIDPRNFKKPRRDEILVSVAGVAMNLILAIAMSLVLKLMISATGMMPGMSGAMPILEQIVMYIIYMNLVLMVFNLLPVPPLDGFNLITEIFDLKRYGWWYTLYNNGFLILLLLIVFNITDMILGPALSALLGLMYGIIF